MVNPQGISIAANLLESEGVAPANARKLEELRKLCRVSRHTGTVAMAELPHGYDEWKPIVQEI